MVWQFYFNKKIFKNIVVLLSLLTLFYPVSLSATYNIKEHKEKLKRIEKKIKRKERAIKNAQTREKNILNALKNVEKDLAKNEKKILRLKEMIKKKEDQLKKVRIEKRVLIYEMEKIKKLIAIRLEAMYKIRRVGIMKTFFSFSSSYKMMVAINSLKKIVAYDKKLMERYADKIKEREELERRLVKEEEQLKRYKNKLKQTKNEISKKLRKKRYLIALLKKERKLYEQEVEELKKKAKKLSNLINELVRKGRVTKGKGIISTHSLSFPVNGRIETYFDGKLHMGITIFASPGAPIYAISDGVVVYSGWMERYGNLLIIDHGRRYHTVTAYNGAWLKKKGETVKKGEIIGYISKKEPEEVYFEIRYKTKPIDPLKFLAKR
ncbi:MAG: hypothetical protein DRG20_03325 [Deltaproteobacteria bacterium]|nr:peptidoglycan DD-metalloendopeptidase family protein [Deltaproteobacteria bacterium]RLA90381.1 MAG: hypothetical protein DRG20_03325 [Deltaproteobacteria bacterium]